MSRSLEWPAEFNLVSVCRKHFFHSFKMFTRLLSLCPGELWHEKRGGGIFWQQLLHTLEEVAHWLRLPGDKELSCFPGMRVYPRLDRDAIEQLSKKQLSSYQEKVGKQAERFFDRLTEDRLVEPSPADREKKQLDAILLQIRHLQYHCGHCHSILRDAGVSASPWRE